MRTCCLALLLTFSLCAVERTSVFPAGTKLVGPYSPGIMAGDYLYVSGQGARDAAGKLPDSVDAQTRQCLENIKSVVERAGLGMDNIVYTHTYLIDIRNYAAMNAAYATYFHDVLPARSTMGVARMPLDTPVEISAIAIRDRRSRSALNMTRANSQVPLSSGILTPDRIFLSGILGRDSEKNATPPEPQAQIDVALKRLRQMFSAAKSDSSALVYLNAYFTPKMPRTLLERALRAAVPHAAISLVDVSALPFDVFVGITGVAVRDTKQKSVYEAGGETRCAAAGDTVYCAAQGGTAVADVLKTVNIGLKALGTNLSHAVANTVYLGDIENFKTMNQAYALAFLPPSPTRTTVQPMPPGNSVKVAVVAIK